MEHVSLRLRAVISVAGATLFDHAFGRARRPTRRRAKLARITVLSALALALFPAIAAASPSGTTNPDQLNGSGNFTGFFSDFAIPFMDEVPSGAACQSHQTDPMHTINCEHLVFNAPATGQFTVVITFDPNQADLDLSVHDKAFGVLLSPVAEGMSGNCGSGCTTITFNVALGQMVDIAISPFFFTCPPGEDDGMGGTCPNVTFSGTLIFNAGSTAGNPSTETGHKMTGSLNNDPTPIFTAANIIQDKDDAMVHKGKINIREKNNSACRIFKTKEISNALWFDTDRRVIVDGFGQFEGSSTLVYFKVQLDDGEENGMPDKVDIFQPTQCAASYTGRGELKYHTPKPKSS